MHTHKWICARMLKLRVRMRMHTQACVRMLGF